MLNRSGQSGHAYPFPNFRGKELFTEINSSSLLSMRLAVGLSYMTFITLRETSLLTFWRDFLSQMDVEFYQQPFLNLLKRSYDFYPSVC